MSACAFLMAAVTTSPSGVTTPETAVSLPDISSLGFALMSKFFTVKAVFYTVYCNAGPKMVPCEKSVWLSGNLTQSDNHMFTPRLRFISVECIPPAWKPYVFQF